MDFQWNLVWDSVPTLLDGAILTLKLTTIAVSIGVVLGTVFGIMRLSRTPLRYLAVGYIDFIRGTPLLVQIFIIYYGMPPFIGTAIPPYIAALIALSINSGAYVAEIVRAGIQSIEKG
jgi:glutamine transport system permease protein